MHLLSLATQHRTWLAARQTAVAENIANANTPGFHARTAPAFDGVLAAVTDELSASHARHLQPQAAARSMARPDAETRTGSASDGDDSGAVTHSGNTVNLEQELLTAAAVNREYSLNVSVVKAFRRMLMAGLRS